MSGLTPPADLRTSSGTFRGANGRHCYFRDLRKGINLIRSRLRRITGHEETGMKLPRRQFLHLAAGAAALPAASRFARAQTYPAHPVHIIVGFTAGNNIDIVARLIGQWLSERLGQPFIIENRPGASGPKPARAGPICCAPEFETTGWLGI